MKKINSKYLFSFLVIAFSFAKFGNSQVDVTFKVDMQYQTVSENGIHLAGAMQGWDPSSTPLSDNGNGIWEVTLSLTEFTSYEYKFINGNSWGSDEQVYGDCGAGNGNRYLYVDSDDIELPAYVFNSCDFTVYGCTDFGAVNYDSNANNDDGSCEYPTAGCLDILACNYNSDATEDDGSCIYAQQHYDCNGFCINDADGDNVCDELEVSGCMDNTACNYNLDATDDDGSCTFPQENYDCDGNCIATPIDWIGDQNGDGFISYDDNGNLYLTVESYPNTGVATLTLNGQNYAMDYQDWGANAHWYWMVSSDSPPMDYDWEVSVINECNEGQALSGSFSTIPSVAYVNFVVDMNGVDYPNADYDNVVVNGSWNGWNGWGVVLADPDGDGVFTGGLEIAPGTSFEYVVAVTGSADGWSGWGIQWGDGCANANVAVTAGDAGSVTESSLTAGCGEILGCLDQNASNYNADATEQGYDQYGNLQCVYASCDDVPGDGCIYADGFGYFNDEFGPDLCVTYGGTPCGGGCDDTDNDGICDDEDSCVGSQASGVRYIDEVFNCVDVTSNVVYGQNVTVLPLLQGAPPSAQPLVCDIYQPEGDTEENRPLIIYIHTGNFLPQYLNGSAVGTKTDNVAVELCTRFARMGYVVASIDYRTGWNPLAATQSDRTYQLINAAYRGVQDARTAVRYFRMNADVMGNEYNIDPANIGYFGEGTGGYVSYAASTISDYNDIILDDTGMPIAKFWTGTPGSADYIPMVIEAVNGDPEAKFDGYAPAGVFGPDPVQLCIGQYPDYSSDIQFQMNMGGALGDLNWLDQGDAPMVSFQCPHDQFAPYTTDVLVVPTTNELVVEVSGAYDVHAEINGYPSPNNNVSFQSANLTDDLSLEALNNGGFDGMYPVLNNYDNGTPTEPFDGAPWQWWDVAAAEAYDAANGTTIAATQLTLNPTMSEVEAMYWIDVIQGYTAPRLALAFGVADIGPGCVDETACNFNALATSDDGSCTYADAGFDCEGNSLNIEGCTNPFACDYNPAATVDTGCTYLTGDDVPTGTDNVWLVGLTVTGTPFEAFAGGCEAAGGVNPNLSINGVIVGDGSAPLTLAGVTDPTGLLADLVALTSTVEFSACGANMTVSALGNLIPMVGNGQFWISPIPVNEDGQYLWAGPMMNFDMGCGDPTACNFSGNPCELSIACSYPGCADVNAANYDAGAGCPDNTLCIYLGCTDPTAFNYDENATDDDGTCVPVIEGCTNTEASNWDATANTDDGSCELDGCTYEDANNYDADATNEDGSCEFSLGNDCIGDLNGDGVAATSDLLLFLSVFGQSCE